MTDRYQGCNVCMAHCFLILLNIGTSYFSDILVAQYKSIYNGYLAESSPTQEIAFRDGPFDIQGGGGRGWDFSS